MASKKRWIQAMHLDEGALTKKAKDAGVPLGKFITKSTKKGSQASTKTKRQANAAKILKSFHK